MAATGDGDGTETPSGEGLSVAEEIEAEHEAAIHPPRSGATAALPREAEIERSFDRILAEGIPRLRRGWPETLATGAVAGFEVAFGILALLVVDHDTGSTLLGGLAFSIGFIALRLGHSELFTEGFLIPTTTVAAGEARVRDLVRLWAGTLAGNLLGGWVMAVVIDDAFPELQRTAVAVADHYVGPGVDGQVFCLAVLAGGAITLLTRMHQGTESDVARLAASVAIAFVLAGIRLDHSVLDSLLAFVALQTGHSDFGWAAWAGWAAFVVVGNVVGGLGLTTVLRLVRTRARLIDHRLANDLPVPLVGQDGAGTAGDRDSARGDR